MVEAYDQRGCDRLTRSTGYHSASFLLHDQAHSRAYAIYFASISLARCGLGFFEEHAEMSYTDCSSAIPESVRTWDHASSTLTLERSSGT